MKPLPFLLIACLCSANAPSAHAQAVPWTPRTFMTQSLNSCFDAGQVFLDETIYGYDDYDLCLVGVYMQPYTLYGMTRYFEPGTSYIVIAAGDEDATNVDLRISNETYEVVAQDLETDRIAIVEFTPKAGANLTIEVELYEANTASFVSFVVLREYGVQISRNDLDIAAASLMNQGETMNQDQEAVSRYLRFNFDYLLPQSCLFGGLVAGGDQRALTNLSMGGGDARVIAAGGSNVDDIDLILYDSSGYELVSDVQTNALPVVDYYTSFYSTYQVEIVNHASLDGLPTFCMVGVMQIRP